MKDKQYFAFARGGLFTVDIHCFELCPDNHFTPQKKKGSKSGKKKKKEKDLTSDR